VPVLFALVALDPETGAGTLTGYGYAIGQALLAIGGIVAFGRLALRPLFRSVVRTKSEELFVAACLLVVIAAALATAAAGLSMALGALIGGLLLAGTEYRRQVEVTISPFKGLLVGLFLISIGMSLDVRTLLAHPVIVLGSAIGLVALKALIVAGLARGFGLTWGGGAQAGLLLGPGGEFGFVIRDRRDDAPFARRHHRQSGADRRGADHDQHADPVEAGRQAGAAAGPAADRPDLLLPETHDPAMRVILAGFGRVGQTVAAMLEAHHVPYVALDHDADRVALERRRGRPVYYGDMTRTEMLQHLDLDSARALVVTLDNPEAANALVTAARAARADLLIVARARDAEHAARLYRAGGDRCGAGNDRGQSAIGRGRAGRCRHCHGSGDRLDP